jgi:phosphoribosylformylglycinamidine (FGAM) synthase-like enzyme
MLKVCVIIPLLALGLGACATTKVDPATVKAMGDQFVAMGCKGTASIAVGGATAAGASPGSAHAEFTVSGACDPSTAPRPTIPPAAAP